jgi:group I intron endonuclease
MDVIYKITSPTNKVYIGRTSDFKRRMTEHKQGAYSKKYNNSLYRAIRKYGWDNMTKEIIIEVEPEKAQKIEEELIIAHNSVRKGYNDTFAGGGGSLWEGRRDTDEYMEFTNKMSEMNLGNKNPMYGKTHSKSAIQKQKEKAKGRFSLPWYIDRHGIDDGTRLYEERRQWLKSRNLPTDEKGQFIKKK